MTYKYAAVRPPTRLSLHDCHQWFHLGVHLRKTNLHGLVEEVSGQRVARLRFPSRRNLFLIT